MRPAAQLLGTSLVAVLLAGCGGGDPPAVGLMRLHGPRLAIETRPDTTGRGSMFSFALDDEVETFGSKGGRFLLHFARTGPNAVPAADVDSSGVPDFIEHAADTYDEVVTAYEALGFLAPLGDENLPDNGGDGRFDVYLVDFAGQGDGHYADDACGPNNGDQCAGYMVQENDFKGYGYPSTKVANRVLASHEFFHAVQSAYDDKQGAVLAEGTAVWATETFDDTLDDFEGLIPGYLQNPDRPLDQPQAGATDAFSYGTGIFWEFLGERYQKPLVLDVWKSVANGAGGVANPAWWDILDPLLQKEANATFAEAFVDFTTWNLFTGKRADPTRSYQHGARYSGLPYEPAKLPYSADALRVFYASAQYFQALPGGRAALTAALVSPPGGADETDGLALLMVPDKAGKYGEVKRFTDLTGGIETLDTQEVDDVVVWVVNGRQAGPSRKPALCVGTVAEVAACSDALRGAGGSAGAGGHGGGGPGGGGQGGGSPTDQGGGVPASQSSPPAAAETSGCGCGTTAAKPSMAHFAALALALAALRRRRKSARSA